MVLYDKLIYRYLITSKLKRKINDVDHIKKTLKEKGFSDEEVSSAVENGMKENRSEIFRLKRKLTRFNKK